MSSSDDLEQLKNIGPKLKGYLHLVGISTASELMNVGGVEATKRILSTGVIKPHLMLCYALVGAERNQSLGSFGREEKVEIRADYEEVLASFR